METAELLNWIIDDAAEMVEALREAAPDQPVTACPGWNAVDLSRHLAFGFYAWYPFNISTPADQWTREGLMARAGQLSNDHLANVSLFESGVAEFVQHCRELDLDAPTWAFGGVEPARWWIRRAGTELTVHLTDATDMHGRRPSTTPERHSEAIDEVVTEVFPRLPALTATMSALTGSERVPPAPPRDPATLATDDVDRVWTLRLNEGVAGVERTLVDGSRTAGRGSAADVLAWLHGRPMSQPLRIDGDATLLDAWNLLQRIEF